MNALALTLRAFLLSIVFLIVVRKAWPGEMLGTPLAQLTLGQLLFGLFQIAFGVVFGILLILWLVNFPAKDKRTSDWRDWWIGSSLTLVAIVALPFLYEVGPKKNFMMNFICGTILTAIGWIIS